MEIKNIISKQIWEDRYKSVSDKNETDNLRRVAKFISKNQKEEEEFFNVMDKSLFFSAGRTMANAGIGDILTLNNCFNLNFVPDSIDEIYQYVRYGALTHKAGGGTGYSFSLIRPKGIATKNSAVASGVVSFINSFDCETETILQGGRMGANMGNLSIYHPDIYDFLESKSWDENKLTHFNLSALVDDKFMRAVENDEKIFLRYPCMNETGDIIYDESRWIIKKEASAKELWELILKKAYDTGEYGVLFYDNMNKDNNTWYCETIVGTNPCGEYLSGVLHEKILTFKIDPKMFMGACNLGSLFLYNFVKNPFTELANIDYDKLRDTIYTGVRMLDNIIDVNKFPLKQYENYQKNMRTIGMGITGISDLYVALNMKYGDDSSITFTDYLMNEITKMCYRASIELAKEKGSFKFLDKEKYIQSGFIQKHILFDEEWKQIADDILKYGIRNARLISIAPTGTLSMAYGENCSSGLEPIVDLTYDRKVKMGGQSEEDAQIVQMRDKAYDDWLKIRYNTDCIVKEDVFVTLKDLTVDNHINILSIIAFHTDMSCSKTINLPTDYSFEDTKKVYLDCWRLGIKGVTIFRPNKLRKGIFNISDDEEKTYERGEWKPIANDTVYYKRKLNIGCGKIKLFIGWSDKEKSLQDFYIKRSGRGGCERNLDTTIISMSGMLRLGGNVFNIEKSFEGVGTCPSFTRSRAKGEKVSDGNSCGTAILSEIKKFLKEKKIVAPIKEYKVIDDEISKKSNEKSEFLKKHGEIAFAQKFNECPDCGGKLVHDGCITCKNCGWNKCG
jgi:ribonucleoside-diphosphate reductase alpha chain